jgi:hypothetical protein
MPRIGFEPTIQVFNIAMFREISEYSLWMMCCCSYHDKCSLEHRNHWTDCLPLLGHGDHCESKCSLPKLYPTAYIRVIRSHLNQLEKGIKHLQFVNQIRVSCPKNEIDPVSHALTAFSQPGYTKLNACGNKQWLCPYRPPLWSSCQSSWLQIRRPGFDSRHFQKKVVGLERGPLSLVSTTEELLDRKVATPV